MTYALNPDADPRLTAIGRELEPLVVIDDVLRDPHALVDAAADAAFVPAYGPGGGYPGVRAPAPLDYVDTLVRAIDPLLRGAFGLRDVRLGRAECTFSMVTLGPERLTPDQRVPHVDTVNPLQFAILHYLCDAVHGGTAFYRHRATGYEAITPERLDTYMAVRAGEPAGMGYIVGDTTDFERSGQVAARFNRLAVYRSRVLHSGVVDGMLSDDPRRGRLTANIFLTYRAG